MNEQGRHPIAVGIIGLIAVLAAILLGTTSSASAAVGAETRVGAFNVADEVLVGPPQDVSAGQGRDAGLDPASIVVANGVAAKTESGLAGRLALRNERGAVGLPGGKAGASQVSPTEELCLTYG